MEIPDILPFWIRPVGHVVKVGDNISFGGLDERASCPLTEGQVIVGATAIGLNGVVSKTQHGLGL